MGRSATPCRIQISQVEDNHVVSDVHQPSGDFNRNHPTEKTIDRFGTSQDSAILNEHFDILPYSEYRLEVA